MIVVVNDMIGCWPVLCTLYIVATNDGGVIQFNSILYDHLDSLPRFLKVLLQ